MREALNWALLMAMATPNAMIITPLNTPSATTISRRVKPADRRKFEIRNSKFETEDFVPYSNFVLRISYPMPLSPIVENLLDLHRAAHAPVSPGHGRFHEHLLRRRHTRIKPLRHVQELPINRDCSLESGREPGAVVGIETGCGIEPDRVVTVHHAAALEVRRPRGIGRAGIADANNIDPVIALGKSGVPGILGEHVVVAIGTDNFDPLLGEVCRDETALGVPRVENAPRGEKERSDERARNRRKRDDGFDESESGSLLRERE